MATYHILALDGGGIRGLYTATLLQRLNQAAPNWLAKIDLFAGTSTGGIIALGLAANKSPSDLAALYHDRGSEIFDSSWWHKVKDVGGLAGADYDNTNLKKILTQVLGSGKLASLAPKRVLIPSFELDNKDDPHKASNEPRSWKPKFFHNFPGDDSDGKELIVDVAMRTSAAPTYFPSYEQYIDGGVVANNPSMSALAQALDPSTGGKNLGDVRLLSIGTGFNPTFIAGSNHDWGIAQWAKPLISLMIDGMMGVADYECARLLGEHYCRLTSVLPKPMKLDDVQNIPDLVDAANKVDIASTVAWLNNNF